jgi:hypothetical protein
MSDKNALVILDGVALIESLLTFLQEGFQAPKSILKYLQGRGKCGDDKCKTRGCERLIPYFSDIKPWNRDSLNEFFAWSRQWYKPNLNYYEEPINAVFTLPRIAQFLEQKLCLDQLEINQIFQMEFKGGGEFRSFVPPCLWKGKSPVCSGKRFRNHEMCCDFYVKDLKNDFPTIVGEIKVAVPPQSGNIFMNFLKDIDKCREWLKPDTSKYVNEKFKIKRFDYALAIFIDLTGDDKYYNSWKSDINQNDYLQENIFVRCIHVGKS